MIPLFNLVWQFIVVQRLADSIKLECDRLNIPSSESRPTFGLGQAKNILSFCSIIPLIGTLCSLVFIVVWILYWVKVAEYKRLIIANKDNGILDAEQGIFSDTKNL